jgi:hypothetical protein
MNNTQVAHKFAHGSAASGSNFFSPDGETLYSYGHHFPVARRLSAPGEPGRFLLTSRGYSQSTSRHISYAHRAIFGEIIIADPAEWPALAALTPAEFEAERGRRSAESEAKAREAQVKREALRAARLDMSPAAVARREKARAQRQAAAIRKGSALLARWRAGEYLDYKEQKTTFAAVAGHALRLRGETVQTSGGASVPVEDAREIWPVLFALHAVRRDSARVSFGSFRGLRWQDDGSARIGCHVIPWGEFELIAAALGLPNPPATVQVPAELEAA